jgi:hypothetical protein
MELTEKQIKTLELFSYYARGYGEDIVYREYEIYDCKLDLYNNKWYSNESNSGLESFDKIDQTCSEIIDSLESTIFDSFTDCELNLGTLRFTIDCKRKNLQLELSEQIMITYDSSSYIEFGNETFFNEMIQIANDKDFKTAKIDFNGGGDSGYIENQVYFSGDDSSENMTLDDFEGLEHYIYTWLNGEFGGWEINEGSQGDFTFDFEDKGIILNCGQNEYESDDKGIIFEYSF